MKHVLVTLALCTSAATALAETPMTGDEFEALVTGKTLTFSNGAFAYGTEYYAPNRQVIWAFNNDECTRGFWYDVETDAGTNICFEYENNPTPQCWQVFDEGGKIRAEFMNTPGTSVLYEAAESEPLICGGVGAKAQSAKCETVFGPNCAE